MTEQPEIEEKEKTESEPVEETKTPDKKPIGLQAREDKITAIALEANIDCDMMDARTRKTLLYLCDQELKKLDGFPTKWVQGSKDELQGIKAGLEMCKKMRAKKD